MKNGANDNQHDGHAGYEKRDVHIGKVFGYAGGGMVLLVIIIIFMLDYFVMVREENVYEAVLKPESAELRELRAREIEELTAYRVVDVDKGIYQIPINRAMDLLADEAFRRRESRSGRK